MLWLNDKISIRQLQVLMIINIFGTGVGILPRVTAEIANQDGWLLVVIATLFAMGCVYLITGLCQHYPDKSFFEYSSLLISKPLAFLLTMGLVIRLVLHLGLTIRLSLEVITQAMLPTTPLWIPTLLILLVSGYGASKGYETRARLAEILIFIVLIPIGLVFTIAAFNVDYSNILPVLTTPKSTLLYGGISTLQAFIGIELLLLCYPYVTKHTRIRGAALTSVLVLGAIMTLTTIITLSRFGIYSIKSQIWPVIAMMDSTNLPGSFIQRQGVLVMSFFIISVFAIVNACLFFSSLLMKSAIKKGKHPHYVALCMILGFVVSVLPSNLIEVYNYMESTFLTFGLFYMFVVPLLLFVIAKLKHGFRPKKTTVALLLVGLAPLFLVGCDKRELEERAFVMSLGIDSYITEPVPDDLYRLTSENPTVTVILGAADLSSPDGVDKSLMMSDDVNLYAAISQVDVNTSKDMYLGLTQTVVLGETLLTNPTLFRSTIDGLSRNRELSKDAMLVVASDGIVELLTADTKENRLGPAQPKFRKKDASLLDQLNTQSIESITKSLYRTGAALLPVIKINNGYVELEHLAVISGYELAFFIDKPAFDGYLFAFGDGVGITLNTTLDDISIPFKISKVTKKTHYHLGQTNDIILSLDLKIQGSIESYGLDGLFDSDKLDQLKANYEQLVKTKLLDSYALLTSLDLDVFGFEDDLRKYHPEWHSQLLNGNLDLLLDVSANISIESIGAIK